MKSSMARVLALATLAGRSFGMTLDTAAPIGKVLSMLSDLQQKIVKEGEAVQKEFAEFHDWCGDRAQSLEHEIKTGTSEVDSLKATIDEQVSTIASLTTRLEDVAASIAEDEAELKAATEVRASELKDFKAAEKDLMETVDMIGRATKVLEREMSKGGAAMLQVKNAAGVVQALNAMVDASMIVSSDAAKLTALVQASQSADMGELDAGAPAAAVYESKSGGIVDTLQDLQEKAEAELEEARKKEEASAHNFEMMKQSLEDEMKNAKQELAEAKKGIAASQEKKSRAEGELGAASKDLQADIDTKATLQNDCMTKAADYEAETKSRSEELAALAKAKQVIEEATAGGAAASFVQMARSRAASRADLAHLSALRFVRDLARKQHSSVLAQLATKMADAMHSRSGSADAFAKIKTLLTDLISKLEAEATAAADKKAYCDKELKETTAKEADKTSSMEALTTKLEQASAKSAKLKEEVAVLEAELAALSKSQAKMDKMRQEEKVTFDESKAELETGLGGLRKALQVLRDYYAKEADHASAGGSASGIISMIEVCESDMAKNLAEITTEEDAAVREYEDLTQKNEVEKMAKSKDVEYKVKESKELDATSAETTSDRSGVEAELEAITEYLSKVKDECIATPESYEETKQRREAELAGLKQALEILQSETALVQRGARRRVLRGSALRP